VPRQKLTKRKIQAQKTKKKIYDIAMKLMNKKGFDNTTIAEISKAAKVSVGTFYLYYKSKDDIFSEIYQKADVFFKNQVFQELENKKPLDQIVGFFQHYARYNQDRGVDAISQLYNTKNKLFIAKSRYMHILLEKILQAGQVRGDIKKDMSIQGIADFLFVMARGTVYDWCLHDGEYDLEANMVKNIERLLTIFRVDHSE
jgi:AcrR family transcriptional regulator